MKHSTHKIRFAMMSALAAMLAVGCAKPVPTVQVFEFYNAALDRYFRTANAQEAEALRKSPAAGEVDTGNTFVAYPAIGYPEGAKPVCRFYGSQSPGPNSHFYTADSNECDKLKQLQQSTPASQKRWNFEEVAFAIRVPNGESCPSDAPVPIYRVYNQGFTRGKDSNHRLVADKVLYQKMIGDGWAAENVVMCALKG